jgi:DtxR family Mn-dependent transcriptional regulator
MALLPREAGMTRTSAAREDYLRAIYDLGRDGSQVPTTALAERLGVTPASVTGMLKQLDQHGLVVHTRYAGVRLTPEGERVALEVIRHHRLIETYLAEALGLGWDAVHEEAHRLEHHISEDLEDRMAEALGNPTRDPHGAWIPPKAGPFEEPRFPSLAESQPGERLLVQSVPDEDAERLRYLASLGIRPDALVAVRAVAPDDGPLTVLLGGVEQALGRALAALIRVRPAPAASA